MVFKYFCLLQQNKKMHIRRVCLSANHLAGQLWLLHATTGVGLGNSLHPESSTTTSSSPSVSIAQYSTLLATPPPHVTLQTPCLERHLVVAKDIFSAASVF